MILHNHSDGSYLSAPKAHSRAGGYYFLRNPSLDTTPLNGSIHCEATIMRHVLSSSPEAEIASLFHNAQKVIPIRHLLTDLGHPQPPTPIQTDNEIASICDTTGSKITKHSNKSTFIGNQNDSTWVTTSPNITLSIITNLFALYYYMIAHHLHK